MRAQSKITPEHLAKQAYVYVRQSSPGQVLNHPESARRQRDLVRVAGSLGWPPSRIVVLDEDQGKSGTTSTGRGAFKRIVGDVSVGEVGIVIGLEIARLARNCADFFPMIEMCALTHTLVADEDGVYDPNEPNDRLVLGIKGTLSEAESHVIRARLQGARWSLARRGELRRKIPTGYAWDDQGRVVMDPDERVRSAFACLFRLFPEVGSACALARRYEREGLLFPSRYFRAGWAARPEWKPLTVRHAQQILHNPFYAGAYCYGQRRTLTTLDPETKSRKSVRPYTALESMEVLIRDAHTGYVSWDEFLANRQRMRDNRSMSQAGPGAVRSGAGLLQGIAFCGRCGHGMSVSYASGRYALYQCRRMTALAEHVYCQTVSASRVDCWVEERILEAIQPAGIEAAVSAIAELERRSEDIRRQWQQRIEQAEYETRLARRRYEQVDPDNRLVAGNLEHDWEEKLRQLDALRKEYAERALKPPIRLLAADLARLHELARDLPRLWRAKTTKQADRKRVVRILVRDVWLTKEDDSRTTRVQVHWQTGAVTEGRAPWRPPEAATFATPRASLGRIRDLHARGCDFAGIAAKLNQEGLRTGRGNEFTQARVRTLVRRWKLGSADAGRARPPADSDKSL